MFIGLNPSTADETQDDPTIRRCIGFAKLWGMGGLIMTNIFSFRATDPKVMKAEPFPSDEFNAQWITLEAKRAKLIVAAWGSNGDFLNQDMRIRQILFDAGVTLHCLGKTKFGQPKHPLYLRADSRLEIYGCPPGSPVHET